MIVNLPILNERISEIEMIRMGKYMYNMQYLKNCANYFGLNDYN